MDAKHQFKYTYNETDLEEYSPHEITFDVPGDATLNQMLYNFQSYLKACGFVFDGELEIVDHTFDVMDELDGTLYEFKGDCPPEKVHKLEDLLNGKFDKDVLDESEGSDIDEEEPQGGCMADFDKECGCETTSSPLETSKDSKWKKAEKMLKEWNEGIAKLDNEQKQKCMEEALKMSDLHYKATKEVVKNNWVHGICNPPSPDWKKKK